MTFKQIKNSWSQTRSKGTVQDKFSDEMAKRTVLNRAAKNILNTSDDSDLVVGAINNTTSNEYDDQPAKDVTPKTVADIVTGSEEPQSQSTTPEPARSVSEASKLRQNQKPVRQLRKNPYRVNHSTGVNLLIAC